MTATVRIKVWEDYSFNDMSLDDAIAELQRVRASVPEEFRAKAMLEQWAPDGLTREVWYDRPETQADRDERKAAEKRWESERREQDLGTLEALAKRYGKKLS